MRRFSDKGYGFYSVYSEMFEDNEVYVAGHFTHGREEYALSKLLEKDWEKNGLENTQYLKYPNPVAKSVDEILELQENMKSLETDKELLSNIIKYNSIFYRLVDRPYGYFEYINEAISNFKKNGEEFLSFLEKHKKNKILAKWYSELKPKLKKAISVWAVEEEFIYKVSSGLAFYQSGNEKGLKLKPFATFEESDEVILKKITKELKKGTRKGYLNFGNITIPFQTHLGEYNVSSENKASIIKGEFPLYTGYQSLLQTFNEPFKDITRYLRLIYFTTNTDKTNFCYPKIDPTGEILLDVENLSPYALEVMDREDNLIKNNIKLTKDKPVLFISGANDGGKTTFLRSIDLLCDLTNLGAKVPATKCIITPHNETQMYFPEVGRSSGTFKTNLSNLKDFLERSNENYLNLIDEPVMGGTDLSALKEAFERFLERLQTTKGTHIIATNHSEWLQEDMPFSFYKMNKKHKLSFFKLY